MLQTSPRWRGDAVAQRAHKEVNVPEIPRPRDPGDPGADASVDRTEKADETHEAPEKESGVMHAAAAVDPAPSDDGRMHAASDALRERLAVFDTLVAGAAHALNHPLTYGTASVQ